MEIVIITFANVSFGQLRVLVTVVDQNGFTAAAKALGTTQSGVSQAVRSLEEAVGVTLVARRRGGGVELTEIGQRALTEARAALGAVDRFRQHCASSAGLDSGTVRIGSVASAAARLLPAVLRAFKTRYPGVEIVLLEGTDAEVGEWVAADAVEIGLTAKRLGSMCSSEPIAEDNFVAVVARGHHLANRRPISINHLSNEPFIMSGSGCEPAIRSFFAEAGTEVSVAFTVRDMNTLFEMVRQGLGATIVPSLSLPGDQTDLRVIELTPIRRRTLFAVTKSNRPRTPAVDAFLQLLHVVDEAEL